MNLKIMFLSLSILASTAWGREDNYQEAQVIGKVSQVKNIVDGCSVKIGEFSFYHESILRPLYQDQVLEQEIFLSIQQCAGLRAGDEISGVLVADENGIILED